MTYILQWDSIVGLHSAWIKSKKDTMKICAILFATVALAQKKAPAAKSQLKCWQCDAMSFDECGSKGQEQICSVRSSDSDQLILLVVKAIKMN